MFFFGNTLIVNVKFNVMKRKQFRDEVNDEVKVRDELTDEDVVKGSYLGNVGER